MTILDVLAGTLNVRLFRGVDLRSFPLLQLPFALPLTFPFSFSVFLPSTLPVSPVPALLPSPRSAPATPPFPLVPIPLAFRLYISVLSCPRGHGPSPAFGGAKAIGDWNSIRDTYLAGRSKGFPADVPRASPEDSLIFALIADTNFASFCRKASKWSTCKLRFVLGTPALTRTARHA